MSNARAPTILIVDDSTTTRAMIKRVIGMTNLAVGTLLEAADGRAALAVLESQTVDLVLADLNMPVMDGSEMFASMRLSDKLRNIPVVVISAQPDPDQIKQLVRDGVAGYLSKPFTPEDVSTIIGPVLEAVTEISPPPSPKPSPSFNLSLAEALVEALEIMAFISPQLPENPALCSNTPDLRVVHIDFTGNGVRGSLALAASAKFGEMVADTCVESYAVHDPDDALKELANITCGLLLRKRHGGGVGFKMSPPIMGRADELAQLTAGQDVITVDADGHLVTAQVTTSEAVLTAGAPVA